MADPLNRRAESAARSQRAHTATFTPRFCPMCTDTVIKYTSRVGFNQHCVAQHRHRFCIRFNFFVPLTSEQLSRCRERVRSGTARRRRNDPGQLPAVSAAQTSTRSSPPRRVAVVSTITSALAADRDTGLRGVKTVHPLHRRTTRPSRTDRPVRPSPCRLTMTPPLLATGQPALRCPPRPSRRYSVPTSKSSCGQTFLTMVG